MLVGSSPRFDSMTFDISLCLDFVICLCLCVCVLTYFVFPRNVGMDFFMHFFFFGNLLVHDALIFEVM